MKKLLCIILAFSLFLMTSLSVCAALTNIAETGKTILQYEDWMLEEIEQGTRWELDQYVGSDEAVYVPRFYNKMLIVSLGDHSFMNNTSVKSVITSSPLWRIGEYAFIDCTSLERIELNFALDTIGSGAFSGTSSLKDINLEDSIVTEIKPYTFLNSGIEEVTIPDTCTKIDNYAFGQCEQMKKITIPVSVTEIHQDAFKGSDNVVIYCYTDSKAHSFAEENSIPFVLLDATKEVTFILGDADGDGVITILDATKLQRILADLDTDEDGMITLRGDIDGDGLNVMDATKIQRHIADYSIAEPVGEEVTREVTTE